MTSCIPKEQCAAARRLSQAWLRRPQLEQLEDRLVPSIPDGTLLVATAPSSFASTDQSEFPTGIIGVNPSTGAQAPISLGGLFALPTYIAEGPDQQLYVTDLRAFGTGAVIRVDPVSGQQTVVAKGGFLNGPSAIVYVDGSLYVADTGDGSGNVHNLVKIDPNTGTQTIIISDNATGGFTVPVGMAPAGGDNVYLADEPGGYAGNSTGQVWEINLDTGAQTLFSQGGLFNHPVDVAVDPSGNIIVANTGGPANDVAGSIFRINPQTRAQSLITTFGPYSGTDSIAVGENGTIFVGAIAAGSNPGAVIAVNPNTGAQSSLTTAGNLSQVEGMQIFHAFAQPAATATTVTSSANPQIAGQPVRWTATVTAATGAVNFVNFESGDFSQTASHVGGAIVTSPALSGTYSLELQRNGSVANVEIRQSGTTYYNLPIAYYRFLFEYTANPGEGGVVNFQDTSSGFKAALHLSSTGQLLFYDSSGNLIATGTTTLVSGQVYALSAMIGTGSNAAWQIEINGTVEMSGTGNLGGGNNGSLKLGGNVAYTATYYYDDVAINSQAYPGPVPTGTVQFLVDGSLYGSPVPLSDGTATSTPTSTLSAGSHTVMASYSGDTTYAASTGALSGGQAINTPSTTTVILSSANPSVFGQPLTLTATVSAGPSATGTPTGSVTFLDGGTSLGTAALTSSGQASFTISIPLAVGLHTLTAVYSGDADFSASASLPITQTVDPGTTTTILVSSANPAVFGQPITLTATVSVNAPASGTPTGSVVFVIDGVGQAAVFLVNGTATLTTASLFVGTHTITATYSGDADFGASSSAPLTQAIPCGPNGSFVNALYEDVLNRAPDPNGFAFWVAQLQAGISRAQLATAFWQSAEHRGIEVDQYYQTLLGRNADAAGRQNWVQQLLAGTDESQVIVAFLTSPEFTAEHADNAAFVRALYQILLNRDPAPAEVASWQQDLQSGLSRAAVGYLFLSSDEADRDAVDEDYQNFLGRMESPQEQQGWLLALKNGLAKPSSLPVIFLASDEYQARASSRPCPCTVI
jgi:sugar lactone lactonase YvrE